MSDNHIGTRVYISAALPATNNAAGFEALTWTEVESPAMAFQFGLKHAVGDISDISTGIARGRKGMASGAESTAAFNEVEGDTGQALAKTTADGPTGVVSVRQVACTGALNVPATGDVTEYAQGILHSYLPNQPGPESNPGFSVTFRQNAATVIDEFPAP